MKHDAVSTCIMACRTAEEVNGVCDAAAADISDEVWEEFAATFDDEVLGLTEADHWWYVRGETVLN